MISFGFRSTISDVLTFFRFMRASTTKTFHQNPPKKQRVGYCKRGCKPRLCCYIRLNLTSTNTLAHSNRTHTAGLWLLSKVSLISAPSSVLDVWMAVAYLLSPSPPLFFLLVGALSLFVGLVTCITIGCTIFRGIQPMAVTFWPKCGRVQCSIAPAV